MRFRIT